MSITLTKIPNPFNPEINIVEVAAFVKGKSLDYYIRDLPLHDPDITFVIAVNGLIVTEPHHTVPIADGDKISACAKTEFSVASSVAAWVASWAVGGSVAFSTAITYSLVYGATYLATSFAIFYGMSALVSVLGPDQPGFSTGGSDTEATYGWGQLQQTTTEGVQIPYIFGRNKVAGHIINMFVDVKDDNEILNVMFGLCDHRIDAVTDVRINDQPTSYFKDVATWTDRIGSSSDAVIPEFGHIVTQHNVGATLIEGTPVTWQTDGNQVDHLKVFITAPGGLMWTTDQGETSKLWVYYKIEYRQVGAPAWTLAVDTSILGQGPDAIRKTHMIGPLAPDQYEVRVTRTADDAVSAPVADTRKRNDIRFPLFQEIVVEDLAYPTLAKYAVSALATDQLSGGMPTFTCMADRSTVMVWDESGSPAWTAKRATNPAWIVWSLLNEHAKIPNSRIIWEDFKTWADYCDEDVSGPGEPAEYRFAFNVVIQSGNFWDEIQKIARMGRAAIIRRGTRYGVFLDKYEGTTPVVSHLFTMGNILKDSFSIQYLPSKDRANAVEIEYTDIDRDYSRQVITVYSDDYIASDKNAKKANVSIQAATTQKTAVREGVFRINSNIHLNRVITFDADIDSFACVVGDLFYFQHETLDYDTDDSGRILSATGTGITLDREVTIGSGSYRVLVRLKDGTIVEKDVLNGPGTTNTLSVSAWSVPPEKYDLYSFGNVDTYKKTYRLVGATRADDFTRTITGVEYVPEIYTHNDSYVIEETARPGWTTGKQAAIQVMLYENLTYAADGSYTTFLQVSWHSALTQISTTWAVWIEDITGGSAGTPVKAGTTPTQYFRIPTPVLVNHVYRVYVVIDGEGPVDSGANTETITVLGKLAVPSDVLAFSAVWDSIHRAVHFSWTHVPDIDLDRYEIRVGSWQGSKILSTRDNTGSYFVSGEVNGTVQYHIKAIDTSGKESKNAKSFALTFNTASTELAVPTGLAWTSTSNIGTDGTDQIVIEVDWNANAELSSRFDHYDIFVKDNVTGRVFHFYSKANTFQFFALPNHSYTIAVAAVDRAGNATEYCTGVTDTTTKDAIPPSVPSLLTANGTFTQVILKWSHGAEADLDHFTVFRNSADDTVTAIPVGAAVREFSGTLAMFQDTPPDDSVYHYWVKAVDTSGNESGFSVGASAGAPGVTAGVGPGEITETEIADDAVSTPKIRANSIIASHINGKQIGADQIAAGSITADEMNVANLSSIAVNAGTITAGRLQNASNTTYLDLNNGLFRLGGGLLDFNGSTLSLGSSATIAGQNAATVVSQAASGASFTNSTPVSNSQMAGVTSIMGGKITTTKIIGGQGSYIDLVYADARIGSSVGSLYIGGSGYIGGGGGSIWMNSANNIGTSIKSGAMGFTVRAHEVIPTHNISQQLGTAARRWNWINCAAVSTLQRAYLDTIDDLDALHAVKSTPDGDTDMMSLPKIVTTHEEVKKQLMADNYDMLTEEEIEEAISDPENMGHLVGLNLGNMLSLVEGSVRQTDREYSDLIEQMADWASDIDQRLKKIEGV
ncbi:MAG: phage tail protein [Desulfobacterales bacterium]|nr:phage tail protein [Desulfobacterales bacterium]